MAKTNKTDYLQIRIDPQFKAESQALFDSLGISTSEAITLFLEKCLMERDFPFRSKVHVYFMEKTNKTDYLQIRIDPQLKAESQALFDSLGISTSEAITLFLKECLMKKDLPYQLKVPGTRILK